MSARRVGSVSTMLAVLVLAGIAGGAATASVAPTAKLKTCKAGTNKRKCVCPTGSTRKKGAKGYRCVRKAVAPAPPKDTTSPTPAPAPTAPSTPAASDRVRNDQALIDALKSAAFYKTYSGGGFGSYAYNFLPAVANESSAGTVFRLRYCTYYYATGFTTSRDNYDGLWGVKEGYVYPARPGLVTGVLQIYRQALGQQVVEAGVGVEGGNAQIETGNGSSYFEPGVYSYRAGQATTDCSVWEPA